MSDVSFARQAQVCVDSSSFFSCRWVDNCRDVVFRPFVVGTWAVRRGSPLSESDDQLACSMVISAAMYVAVATSWRHSTFVWHTHVDHRVVWHVILTQRCSMCGLFFFFLRFDGFGAVHCDTLATKLYLKSFGV